MEGSAMMTRVMTTAVLMVASFGARALAEAVTAPQDAESGGRTQWSDLIRRIEPGVVAIIRQDSSGKTLTASGSIIHEAGFILTSERAIQGQPGYVLIKGLSPVPYRVVGRLPEKDIALIQAAVDRSLPVIALGRSNDMAAGQSILVAGNPGARGIAFSAGMIGAAAILANASDPWAAVTYSQTSCDRYVQFDTPGNPGNAGGPLFDSEGLQVGLVTGKKLTDDNVNLAIPIDRVRRGFRSLVAAGERDGTWAGMDVDILAPNAVIAAVEPNGPASKVGLKVGDQIVSLYGRPARDGLSWILALVGRRPGEAVVVTYSRKGKQQQVNLTLDEYPLSEPFGDEGLSQGLRYGAFQGNFTAMPDLSKLDPVAMGTAPGPQATGLQGARDSHFALAFLGYVDIPQLGVYRVVLGSDGGSRLFLDGALLVDNEGPHPYQETSGIARLAEGLHSLRIDYYETIGDPELGLRIEPDNPSTPQPVIPLQFYCE
jgi:S1-C subfamily serine protease